MDIYKKASKNKYWTTEDAAGEAMKYSTRTEFSLGSPRAYRFAVRVGILDHICRHMENPTNQKWTDTALKSEAEKYKNRTDFRNGSPKAYQVIVSRRIMEYMCSHMEEFQGNKTRKMLIKKLSKFDRAIVNETNEDRISLGLKPHEVKIRSCLACGIKFESIGDRTCGCIKDQVTNLFGLEVV